MPNRLSKWLGMGQNVKKEVGLEDVQPLHPNEYPARHLKQILDERRSRMEEVVSHPTGMWDGPDTVS